MENNSDTTGIPLGRVFRMKELKGWFGKVLNVPSGRQGVVIEPSGKQKLLPPGKHRILSVLGRLRGKGIGLATGYVPQEPFMVPIKFPYMLSGDGELLDLTLVGSMQVVDPARFFSAIILPQGEFHPSALTLGDDAAMQAPAPIFRKYAAEDLIHGTPPHLDGELLNNLQSLGTAIGLSIQYLPLISITRADDRALIAEKTQALNERLQQVDIQKMLADIENQVELEEFIQQLDPELQKLVQLKTGGDSVGGLAAVKTHVGEAVRNWLNIEADQDGSTRRWQIEDLFRKKSQETSKKLPASHRQPRFWWLSRVIWMVFLILLGWTLHFTVIKIADAAGWDSKLEFLIALWAVIIPGILESIKALYEKRESIDEATWTQPGFQLLDDLVKNDRQWADELVRDQCHAELQHVIQVLQDIRSREYKRENTTLALRLRNEIERNVADCSEKVLRPDYGHPPYLTELHISRRAWNNMLDYDEDLLLFASALSDKVQQLQEASQADALEAHLLTSLDKDVMKFCSKFFERGRPLKVPSAD